MEDSFLASAFELYTQQANQRENSAGVARQDCPAETKMIANYCTQQTHLEVSTIPGWSL